MVTETELRVLRLRRCTVKVYELLIDGFCATVILRQSVVNENWCRCSRGGLNPSVISWQHG